MKCRHLIWAGLFFATAAWAQAPAEKSSAAPPTQASQQPAAPSQTPGGATHVMGFEDAKRDARGKLIAAEGKLKFAGSAIDIASISDIFTGFESRQVGGTPLTLVKIAAPFGSGRALSLFAHQQVDNITIEYSDANGGLHEAIFLMPKGNAERFKKELAAQGAYATVPPAEAATPKEKK